MDKVYLLEKGYYDELLGVFSTQEKAEQIRQIHINSIKEQLEEIGCCYSENSDDVPRIKEQPLDVGCDELAAGKVPWSVSMNVSGELRGVEKIKIGGWSGEDTIDESMAYTIGEGRNGQPPSFRVSLFALDQVHAAQEADALRQRLLASGEWKPFSYSMTRALDKVSFQASTDNGAFLGTNAECEAWLEVQRKAHYGR